MPSSSLSLPRGRTVLALLGIGSILLGLLTIHQSAALLSIVGSEFEAFIERPLTDALPLLVAGVLVGLGVLRGALRRLSRHSADERLRPEADHSTTDITLTGSDFDRTLDQVLKEVDRSQSTDPAESLQQRLWESAADTLVAFGDVDRAGAENALATGTWTDDPIAAAFLSDASGPSLSFLHRIYAWLYPRGAVKQRVERTVSELQAWADTGGDDG